MKELSFLGLRRNLDRSCNDLVLMCMDFRFHRQLGEILTSDGYRTFDIVALPGSSKSLRDAGSREVVLSAIRTAVSIHSIKRVIIADHVDCRAYGGSEAHAGSEQEMHSHEEALREAGQVVKGEFPALEVVLVYADWDHVREVDPTLPKTSDAQI